MITRSQARSKQPLDRVASPGANHPRQVLSQRSGTSRQSSSEEDVDNNSVINTRTAGGRSVISAGEVIDQKVTNVAQTV